MQVTKYPGPKRGYFDHQWLQTYHSFSFADWVDYGKMGWGALRVLNDDVIQPGQGFGTHGHKDMEIVTVLLTGTLAHRDSQGNQETLLPGELQYMCAGTGIRHSEFNGSPTEPLRLFQIWILPSQANLPPGYKTVATDWLTPKPTLTLCAAPTGAPLPIQQDTSLWLGHLPGGTWTQYPVQNDQRRVFVQVAEGRLKAGGVELDAGDGAAVKGEGTLDLEVLEGCKLVLIDSPSLGRD